MLVTGQAYRRKFPRPTGETCGTSDWRGYRDVVLPRIKAPIRLCVVLALLGLLAPGLQPAHAAADNPGWSVLKRLSSNAQWATGATRGTVWRNGTLVIGTAPLRRTWDGVTWDYSQWTSPWVSPGRAFTQLVPSWQASTPPGTAIAIYVRARTADGRVARWQPLGRWASHDAGFRRTSLPGAPDTLGSVNVDTFTTKGPAFTRWQMSALLLRKAGSTGTPSIRSLHAMTSRLPSTYPATSTPVSRTAVELPVPRYSQMIHQGQHQQYGGGGNAWCSPTSLAMVLGYYGRLPAPASYAWVPAAWPDRFVNHLARQSYDYRYRGTGNWPFNTGLAATYLGDAFVTRLPDLRQAERFIRNRIPVVASIRFSSGGLSGAPISSTPGHLLVIVGFTAGGNVIVNDPAASRNAYVRRVYDRAQFERAWVRGSGGTSYIIRTGDRTLPARPAGVLAW